MLGSGLRLLCSLGVGLRALAWCHWALTLGLAWCHWACTAGAVANVRASEIEVNYHHLKQFRLSLELGSGSGLGLGLGRFEYSCECRQGAYDIHKYASYACPPPMCALWAVILCRQGAYDRVMFGFMLGYDCGCDYDLGRDRSNTYACADVGA